MTAPLLSQTVEASHSNVADVEATVATTATLTVYPETYDAARGGRACASTCRNTAICDEQTASALRS